MLTGDLFGTYTKRLTNFESDLVGFLVDWLGRDEAQKADSIVYENSYQFQVRRDEVTGIPVVYFRMAEKNGTFRDFTPFSLRHPFAVIAMVYHNVKRRADELQVGETR